MSLIISGICTEVEEPAENAIHKAIKYLGLSQEQVLQGVISKTSVDARHRTVRFVHSVALTLGSEEAEKRIGEKFPKVQLKHKTELSSPVGDIPFSSPPIVVGFGPAGMFAALYLAEHGCRPIVLERGEPVEKRTAQVETFWKTGELLENSNVQFGEGGAGTFSDGKLTTRIHDPRCDYVLERFVSFGAPKEILVKAKPHIGTDLLRGIVRSIRERILELGGEIRFACPLEDIKISQGRLYSVRAGKTEMKTQALVLAIGHSARDTFSMLFSHGVPMESKPFSVGVRVEQLQRVIEEGLYGSYAGHPLLPKGEYALSHRIGKDCVYTFCMCPGGLVVPAASERDGIVTNGMSYHARDGRNANSALVVSVDPKDLGNDVFSGVRFQQMLEQQAFSAGGGTFVAPMQTAEAFLKGKAEIELDRVQPTYSLGGIPYDFAQLFPDRVTYMLKVGLQVFGKKLAGFSNPDTILTGVETRTSSPIRILRGKETFTSEIEGLYPCGEGAGYAGGIMSAAVDGIRVAEAILNRYCPTMK